MKRWLVARGGLLALAALALYLWLAPTHVVDGDNAEFSGLARLGGIAHPSGYPLYLLWLHATSWLPGATAAHTAALATAIAGAGAVLVLHAACRAWGARPLAATIACALAAAAPVFVRVASEAEVFAPNVLVAAAVVWLAAREGPLRGGRRAAALGLVAGLGLSMHLTCIFVAPVGLLGVARAAREAGARTLALAVAGLVVGLLPYAYAFVAPDTPLSWGAVRDVDRLIGHFTRREYGTSSLVAHGATAPWTASLVALAATLARAWLWLPLAVGLATFAVRVARPSERGETRVAWAMLAASWLVAGPAFVSRFNAAPEGIGLYIVHRFHVLPVMLLAIPVAVGLDALATWLPERAHAWARVASPLAATLGFAAAAGLALPRVRALHTAAVETGARNVLRMLPERAVVLEYSDELYYAVNYLQWVEGERQDVTFVAWGVMSLPWYRDRVAARGIVAEPGSEPASVRLALHLLGEGRAVFVEPGFAELARAFPTYPFGPLVRVLPRGVPVPPVDDVVAQNRAIYAAFDLAYPRPSRDDEWAALVHDRYAATWRAIAGALDAAGRTDDAAAARELARALEPLP
ncbi:MAG: protein O-mannosyl-transferase family [Acidobacteriota bacterium]